ncbi:MAG: hypothetical protein ACKOAH_12300 [Pirellula sp.]
MANKLKCNRCGSGMETNWKHCPVCGQSVDGVLDNPYMSMPAELSREDQKDRQVVYQQANKDLRNTGVLIQILAYSLALGFVYLFFSGGLTWAGSTDKIFTRIFVVAMITVVLVILGMFTVATSKSDADRSALGIFLQTTLALLKVISLLGLFIVMWFVATVIYILQTCGCIR